MAFFSFSLTSACVFPRTLFNDGLSCFWIVTDCVPTLPASVLSFADISLPVCSSLWHMLSNQRLQAGILSTKRARSGIYVPSPSTKQQERYMRYNLTLRNNLSAVDHQKGPNYPRTGPAPWKMSRFIFYHHARYDRPKDQAYCSKGGLRMRKPSREALTKRIWFDYFNEVLRKQNLIDWNTYQKIKLSIQQ